MREKYNRLCAKDRKVIFNMKQTKFTQTEIAEAMGYGQGTLSKELARNKGQ